MKYLKNFIIETTIPKDAPFYTFNILNFNSGNNNYKILAKINWYFYDKGDDFITIRPLLYYKNNNYKKNLGAFTITTDELNHWSIYGTHSYLNALNTFKEKFNLKGEVNKATNVN